MPLRKKEVPLAADLEAGIAPAVAQDLDLPLLQLRVRTAEVQRDLGRMRQILKRLLFVDVEEKFLHVPLIARDCGKRAIRIRVLGIIPREDLVKGIRIKEADRLFPVALGQIGKMEEIMI